MKCLEELFVQYALIHVSNVTVLMMDRRLTVQVSSTVLLWLSHSRILSKLLKMKRESSE